MCKLFVRKKRGKVGQPVIHNNDMSNKCDRLQFINRVWKICGDIHTTPSIGGHTYVLKLLDM